MTNTFRETALYSKYCAANKLRASFSRCSNAVKMDFFIPFVRQCMHHKYSVISESHACRDCVWPIILDAELYTRASQTFLFCEPILKCFFNATP